MEEIWKGVFGFENHYEVSNLGRARSLDRTLTYKNGAQRFWPGVILKPTVKKDTGYLQIVINKKSFRLNVLIAKEFLGPKPSEKHMVCHKNGIKSDNSATNLYWGTQSENELDKVKHGTHWEVNKTHCPLGHILDFDNLRKSHFEKYNKRQCYSCQQARDFLRKVGREHLDFKETADAYFALKDASFYN